jgi:hypothetical protein
MCEHLFLACLFCSIGLYVCLYAGAKQSCLHDRFVLSFKVRKYDNTNFVLFQYHFGCSQCPLKFHINFGMDLSVSAKIPLDF